MRCIIPGVSESEQSLAYLALYRKYRSQTFSDLIGQEHVIRTLQNSIAQGKVSHAYLFTGPRGTGKTSTARLLAKALNCEKGPTAEPCNQCDNCVSITSGSSMDVNEMDAASESGVDDVRDAIVRVTEYQPAVSKYKVFIIDEVHDLSAKAFDALLKTIEEPPAHVVFILATTEFNKVPLTIRSRCQKFDFRRGTIQDLCSCLAEVAKEEKLEIEPAALDAIARMADGGFRDALTNLEQAMITADGKITLQHVYEQLGLVSEETTDELLQAIASGKVGEVLSILEETYRAGRDSRMVLESMLHRLADLTRASYGIELGGSADATAEASTHALAAKLGRDEILQIRAAISEAHKVIRDVTLPKLWLEAELVKLTVPQENQKARTVSPAAQATVKHQATPAPKPHLPPDKQEAAESSDDQELGDAKRIWHDLVASLGAIPAYKKLAKTRILEKNGLRVRVQVDRRIDFDWIQDDPRRQKFIRDNLSKAGIDPMWELEFVLATSIKTLADPSIELPAEGARLAQIGQEVFKGA